MRIDESYQDITNDLRKTRGGFYPPNQFCKDAYRSELDAMNFYFKGYSATQPLHDALSPFIAEFSFSLADSVGGVINYPSDYAHVLSGTRIVFTNGRGKEGNAIRFFNEDEKDAALKSQVRPVTVDKPIAVQSASKIELFPEVPMTGKVKYLRLPKYPVYNYSTSNRQLIYNPTGSQDIEFSDLYVPDILDRILVYAKRYLDEQVQQTA